MGPLRGSALLLAGVLSCVPSSRPGTPPQAPRSPPTSCAGVVTPDTSVYDFGHVSERPVVRTWPRMTYPREALRRGAHGRVVVGAIVNSDGRVDSASVQVLESVHPLLDAEARRVVRAVTAWPGCRDGVAVRTIVAVPVEFALRRGSGPGDALLIGLAVGLGSVLATILQNK